MSRIDAEGRTYVVTDPAHPVHGLVALDPDGNPVTLAVSDGNQLKVIEATASDAVVHAVAPTAGSFELLSDNPARIGLIITNWTNVDLYIKYGAGAAWTSMTMKIAAWEVKTLPSPVFTGQIDAFWNTLPAEGYCFITELFE